MCIKVGWRDNLILWCTVEKTSKFKTCYGLVIWYVLLTELHIELLREYMLIWNSYLLTCSMEQSPSWEANWFCSIVICIYFSIVLKVLWGYGQKETWLSFPYMRDNFFPQFIKTYQWGDMNLKILSSCRSSLHSIVFSNNWKLSQQQAWFNFISFIYFSVNLLQDMEIVISIII